MNPRKQYAAEYNVYRQMKFRCSSAKKARYGARGIKVCDRWLESFENFIADMGPRPSVRHWIERKNNDGNYEPDNCVWALPVEQARNKSSNVWCDFFGRKVLASDLVHELGVPLRWVRQHVIDGVFMVKASEIPNQELRERIFPMDFEI